MWPLPAQILLIADTLGQQIPWDSASTGSDAGTPCSIDPVQDCLERCRVTSVGRTELAATASTREKAYGQQLYSLIPPQTSGTSSNEIRMKLWC